jgi:uncharacterized protein YjbI with pentapeptide repeats
MFINCNFSNLKWNGVGLKDVQFINCKLVGVDFSVCNDFLFTVSFKECQLDFATFFQKKLKKTKFEDCILKETDFAEVDLTETIFKNCTLEGAVFEKTNLFKADFRTSTNYTIDPEKNIMKKAKFAYPGVLGLLNKYDILID